MIPAAFHTFVDCRAVTAGIRARRYPAQPKEL